MVDVSDAPVTEGVMIAFLPSTSHWTRVDLPHMTLVYAGKKSDLRPSDLSALVKDAASVAMLTSPFALEASGIAVFGPDDDRVNVLKLRITPELEALRAFVEKWNKSEHPFTPHVTIGPVNDVYVERTPDMVFFNRLTVGWGNEYTTFKL